MTTDKRTLEGFRRRLHALIADRFEGKYSRLARRAGSPISSLQYCLHHARRFPGGDHLLGLAAALEVSVDYLLGWE
jgi:ribosomal protein RSM22 (predicted rRNA methylase)